MNVTRALLLQRRHNVIVGSSSSGGNNQRRSIIAIRSLSTLVSSSSSGISLSPSSSSVDNTINNHNNNGISHSANRRTFASWKVSDSSKSINININVNVNNDNIFRKNSALPPIDVLSKKNYSDSTKNTAAAAAATTSSSSTSKTIVNKDDDDDDDENNKKTTTSTSDSKNNFDILGIKTLIPEWKNMFNKETLFTDISAGMTVGCVAVPLSLAIALASGVPAEVGLVTAAVSGVMGGLMGGTTLAVTGPAAAISLLVIGAVEAHGLEALPIITLGCGTLQLISGMTRLGVVAKLCPVSVIAGFTTGVGTLILTNQLPKALGMTAPTGLNPIELLAFIGEHASQHVNPSSAALAIGTSAAMFLLPKIHSKMPSALVAVGGATIATHSLGLDVSLIGNIPSGLDAFQFGLPSSLPPVEAIPSLAASTFLIYSMTSVESLLSCAALEKMKKTTYKHNPDQELIGQGIANVGSALFMGMPVTSVIARSSLNARLNASTRLPALIQSGFVFSSVVFFSSTIALIPMPALSGVLITTGMGMLNPTEFKHCYAVQKTDVIPFIATIGGMISLGLAEGIGIGCTTAIGMNIYTTYSNKTTKSSNTESKMKAFELIKLPALAASSDADSADAMASTQVWQARCGEQLPMAVDSRGVHTMVARDDNEDSNSKEEEMTFKDDDMKQFTAMMDPTKNTVWQLNGPINFLSMFEIDNMIKRIEAQRKTDSDTTAIVLDMSGVTSLEFTGIEELVNRLVEVSEDVGSDGTITSIPIQMVNVNKEIENALNQCDPLNKITRITFHQ